MSRAARRSLRAGMLPGLVACAAAVYAAGALWAHDLLFALSACAGFGLMAALVVPGAVRHHPHARFGAANQVTLARGTGTALLAGLIAAPDVLGTHAAAVWLPFAGAAALLLLDLCDGALARRQGLASAFGARFDQEVDAAAILVLSALAVAIADAPWWTLGIGALHYLYRLGGWLIPALARPLPYSLRRRIVCGVQIAALGALLAPPTPAGWSAVLTTVALVALTLSFLRDGLWSLTRGAAFTPARRPGAGA
ncbi:CDP-alcohol phosphatidyltransferase family protein [Rhodovibrio sodomensis]|nr:CDP-alcohol phosphatidyltransferase family protein [Rhodovibrio sodomensis]